MSRKLINKKNNRGVSLAEMLIVVAILLILMAVAVPSVITIQRNLRQTELDAKAETIYVAVQNKLTSLYTGGRATVYDPVTYNSTDQSMKMLGTYPGDYDPDEDGNLNIDSVYYITSGGGAAADAIITSDVLDDGLKSGHWVIELVPYAYRENTDDSQTLTAATVYAVYYSENRANVAEEYCNGGSINEDYLGQLRSKPRRLKDGARVGYYGGAAVGSSSTTSTLLLDTVKIHSEEEILTATVKCKKPVIISDPLIFRFELSDTKGNKYIFFYDEKNKTFKDKDGFLYDKKNVSFTHVGQSYSFVITLDDLSKEELRFNQLYGAGSGHTNQQLVCGTDIKLEVTVSCPSDYTVESASKFDIGNSLFSETSTENTAVLTCGRHLQNLDKGSNVTDDIKNAQQEGNISFGEQSKWYQNYKDSYFNKIVSRTMINTSGTSEIKVPNFKPIDNDNLEVFNGRFEDDKYIISDLTVSTTGNNPAGLFGTIQNNKLNLNDIMMTGARITSTADAGAIAGKVTSNNVTISGCQVYLSKDMGDIPTSISNDTNIESVRWISAPNAGGLVGNNAGKLKIEKSSASTVIGEKNAGGLVGINAGSIVINQSYADSYLYGTNVGGLIGKAETGNVSLESCYAAGFIGLKDTQSVGAGLVNGSVDGIKNTYTLMACYGEAADNGIDKDSGKIDLPTEGTYYSTVKNVKTSEINKVFYFNGSTSIDYDLNSTSCLNAMTTDALRGELGEAFNINTIGTQPYKLMGQSLTTYTYPRISELAHYGDWETVFQSGALVYYEEYEAKSGNTYFGFDGAGVDISLSEKDTIVGDGYGIVFKQGDSMPSEVSVKIGNQTINLDLNNTPYKKVEYKEGSNTVVYQVYPLDKEIVNPTKAVSEFFTRVDISQISNQNTTHRYYDFNPHFARTVQDVLEEDSPVSSIDSIISIRSPRHLFNLSKYYESQSETVKGYRDITGKKSYGQERDLIFSNYDWENYSLEKSVVKAQEPIGKTESGNFQDTYNGNCYNISGISFISQDAKYIGMFGYVAKDATLKNIVLATTYDKTEKSENCRVQRTDPAEANDKIYYGVLAGFNEGDISNCAVAGYYLSGKNGTILGYANSHIYIGGLVGWNAGVISNSEANCPRMRLSMYRTTCYAGGFVGWNEKKIQNCYDLNHIDAIADGGKTVIAGFVAQNKGSILQSYCATALTASGTGVQSDGFVPSEGGGQVSGCYYLQAGSYQFVDGLYAYETTSLNGTKRTYQQLVNMNNTKAKTSRYHDITTSLNHNETIYPYRPVVKDGKGDFIHYGEWQVKPELGTIGIFYWEHETGGENNGYKLTYIGTSEGSSQYQTTLCTAHDDGGTISSFGYGYYLLNGEEEYISYELDGISKSDLTNRTGNAKTDKATGNYNHDAASALANQMPGYTFFPYTTKIGTEGDYIYLSGENANGTWTLKYNNSGVTHNYKYSLTPFFANSMQYQGGNAGSSFVITDSANNKTFYIDVPGSENNQYEIRSAEQLQYINWNRSTKNTDTLVNDKTKSYYNYLMYTSFGKDASGQETLQSAKNHTVNNWRQTHDVDASRIDNFTPIAGQEFSSSTYYDATLFAWFGGNYDGENYKISEVNIDSKSTTVGLFGVTAGGSIKNIILYSRNNAVIMRKTEVGDAANSYALGGMIGVAYRYAAQEGDIISNCSIAGYTIIDESKNKQNLGEANVGGLIGVANVSLERCSSVVDIKINCIHPKNNGQAGITTALWGNYVRVGGIAGATQFELNDCYSGGNISVSDSTLDENYNAYGHVSCSSEGVSISDQLSTNIYIGGIAGSGFAMNYKNFTGNSGLKEGSPKFYNCYTYMNFPAYKGTIRAIALIGSLADRHTEGGSVTISNCYYLSSSAEIDIESAPRFKVSDGTEAVYDLINSKVTLGNGKTCLEDMLFGNSGYVAKMIKGREQQKLQDGTLYSKTYTELSNNVDDLLNKNRSVWGKVTTQDASGGNITGKYSFPGNAVYLDGKDYPFPTVITQKDSTFGNDVYVHYGEWPVPGAHWTKGTDKINIFDYITEDDGWAIKDYIFDPNGEKNMDNLNKDNFEIVLPGSNTLGSDIAEIDSVEQKSNNTYSVSIKALKEGTVEIREKSSGAAFTLEITGALKVTAEPNTMILGINDTSSLLLKLTSTNDRSTSDFSVYDVVTWNVSSSTENSEDGDAGVETIDELKENKNQFKVRGYGYDATLTATATYDYHGTSFDGTALVNVNRIGVVGLSNGTKYIEAHVKVEDEGEDDNENIETIYGADKKYASESTDRPVDSSNAAFFLYDTASAGILDRAVDGQGVSIVLNAKSESQQDKEILVSLSGGLSTGTTSDFRILTGKLSYVPTTLDTEGKAETIRDVKLTVTITNNDKTEYILQLDNLEATPLLPITVTLHQNQKAITGIDDQASIKDNTTPWRSGEEHIIPEYPFGEIRGYSFKEWNTKEDGSGVGYLPGSMAVFNENTDLYAQWTDKPHLTLVDGNRLVETVENGEKLTGFDYKSSREGWELLGWYTEKDITNGQKVLDPDGRVFQSVQGYTINGEISVSENKEVYACWRKAKQIWVPAQKLEAGKQYIISNAVSGDDLTVVYQNEEAPSDLQQGRKVSAKDGLHFTTDVMCIEEDGTSRNIPIAFCETLEDNYIWKAVEEDGFITLKNSKWSNDFLAENNIFCQNDRWAIVCVKSNSQLAGNLMRRKGFKYSNEGFLITATGSPVNFDVSANGNYIIYSNNSTDPNHRAYLLEELNSYKFSFADIFALTLYSDGVEWGKHQIYNDEREMSYSKPIKDGKEFAGWYTGETDGELVIDSSGNIMQPISSDMTLYARWKDITYITLSYGISNKESKKIQVSDDVTDISQITGDITLEKSGWNFTGWYTKNSGTGGKKVFDENGALVEGQSIEMGLTYYAGWSKTAWAPISSLEGEINNPVVVGNINRESGLFRALYYVNKRDAGWFNFTVPSENIDNIYGTSGAGISFYGNIGDGRDGYRWNIVSINDGTDFVLQSMANKKFLVPGNNGNLGVSKDEQVAKISLNYNNMEHTECTLKVADKYLSVDISQNNPAFEFSDTATEMYILMEQTIMSYAFDETGDIVGEADIAVIGENVNAAGLEYSSEDNEGTDEVLEEPSKASDDGTDTSGTKSDLNSENDKSDLEITLPDAIIPEASEELEKPEESEQSPDNEAENPGLDEHPVLEFLPPTDPTGNPEEQAN